MSGQSFQEALSRSVLVFDGAMGTEIYRHHVFTNRCFDELCLSDRVSGIQVSAPLGNIETAWAVIEGW